MREQSHKNVVIDTPQRTTESASVVRPVLRPAPRRGKILYLVTEDWYFCSHRLPIARAARDAGYDVVVATRVQSHGDRIRDEGFRLIPLGWRRRSLHPWHESRAILDVLKLYRREKPDLVHHIALKPAMYGSLAARLAKVPAMVNTVAGLGYVFTSDQWKAKALSPVFRIAFRPLLRQPNTRVILQNPDDRAAVARFFGARPEQMVLIKGSGVDIHRFVPMPEPGGTPTVAMVSRMLWDKGVGEIVEAARRLRDMGLELRVILVGGPDPENPRSVPEAQLKAWEKEGLVEWHGHVDDVPAIWAQSFIGVLPTSYGEGVPKSLLEAAACARPIIATDVPGCREIVQHEENGLLIPKKNVDALVDAIVRLIEDPDLRGRMGEKGREIVAEQFAEERVIEQTLEVYRALLGGVGER